MPDISWSFWHFTCTLTTLTVILGQLLASPVLILMSYPVLLRQKAI